MNLPAQYDAIGWATGLALSGKIAAITNRIYGIELLDISNPESS